MQEALRKAPQFKAQNISNTLNALAKLDHHDASLLAKLCGRHCTRLLSSTSQDIANTLNALAKFDHHDASLLAKLCREALHKAPQFSAQDICQRCVFCGRT